MAFDFERRIIDAVSRILEKGMEEGAIRREDHMLMAYAIVRLHEAFTFSAFLDLEGYDPGEINEFFINMVMYAIRP